jgi:hypothetical protein
MRISSGSITRPGRQGNQGWGGAAPATTGGRERAAHCARAPVIAAAGDSWNASRLPID